jgi:hypothetical protein
MSHAGLAVVALGAAWVMLNLAGFGVVVCPSKLLTGLPCPGCGVTRAVVLLLRGQPWAAVLMNPLGPLSVLASSVYVLLKFRDAVTGTQSVSGLAATLSRGWRSTPVVAGVALLIGANWAWNIAKGL